MRSNRNTVGLQEHAVPNLRINLYLESKKETKREKGQWVFCCKVTKGIYSVSIFKDQASTLHLFKELYSVHRIFIVN